MAVAHVLCAGSFVLYQDAELRAWPALVTGVWRAREDEVYPTVNLVFVSPDDKRIDSYGRAIERRTSVMHQSRAGAPAGCWRFAEEPVRAFAAVLTH